ncbi:MAG: dihydrodipicolinate synthase family protein [Candidatus Accumulibacter sp.]|jgi:4-hydroxy-tetrahydrodipicolinate synthase|nr:dihydrodipicolinate synthase family protein [Accumulibacter sp.]
MVFHIQGVIPPVMTIFDEREQFDPQGMGRLIDRLLASEVDGFLFLGSAGEFAALGHERRKAIAEFCVGRVAGKKPAIIGAASCATREVIDLARHAGGIGADAVMVVNPYYTRFSEERLYQHYRRIAEDSPLPVLLYNFPALTGHDLSIELVGRLAADCPNIVGIKDTVDCMSHIRRLILEVKGARPDFMVFTGYDEYMLDTLMIGGDGAIPATSNFAPEITCGIYRAFRERDFDAAQNLLKRLAILQRIYSTDVPFTGLIKEAIRLTGLDISTTALSPALAPDEATRARLAEILARFQSSRVPEDRR